MARFLFQVLMFAVSAAAQDVATSAVSGEVGEGANIGTFFGGEGQVQVVHESGVLRGDAPNPPSSEAAPVSDMVGALMNVTSEDAPERRLSCKPVGSICWVNAQCCGGRCVATHRCAASFR